MQLQNSYIFLPNPYSKKPSSWKDKDGGMHIEIGHSIYSHVKKAFPNMTSKELVSGYFQYEYSFSVQLNKHLVDISIISKNVGDSSYVTVSASVERKAQALLIEALEHVHSALFATEIEEDYISIISYDAVSEYYCNKLYPKLNRLERNLRKLLFNIYVLNFGKEYFEATTTKEMQDKAKSIIRAKGGTEKKETQYIQQYFYSLEYADIQQLLFAPRWTKIDEENRKTFLDAHEDLSKLSDEELRAVINGISPKSDWERFFDEKFQGINVEEDIEAVRGIRNNVAHCKFLQKEQYDFCNKKVDALNRALNRVIAITEEKDFDDKNAEYLRKATSGVSSRIRELVTKINESSSLSTQRLKEAIMSVSYYEGKYRADIKRVMEATRTLAKTISSEIKPFPLSDTFKNILNNFTQLPSIDFHNDFPKFYDRNDLLSIPPDDGEGHNEETEDATDLPADDEHNKETKDTTDE